MPKSAKSIDCPCGGHYVKGGQARHFETKKHQKYEDEEEEKEVNQRNEQYEASCGNGCGTILTEDTHIFTLSKGEEEKVWCSTCFDDCGRDAREDGWTFDEEGEEI